MDKEINERLHDLFESLKTERDELRVRMHLMKAEVKDEWEELEEKWEYLEPKLENLKAGAKESAGEIGAATEQLAEEIGNAYRRIKNALR